MYYKALHLASFFNIMLFHYSNQLMPFDVKFYEHGKHVEGENISFIYNGIVPAFTPIYQLNVTCQSRERMLMSSCRSLSISRWSPETRAPADVPASSCSRLPGECGADGADCTRRPIKLALLSLRGLVHSCDSTRSRVKRSVISGSRIWRTMDFAAGETVSLILLLNTQLRDT